MPVTNSQRDTSVPVIIRRESEYPLGSPARYSLDEGFAEIDDDTDDFEGKYGDNDHHNTINSMRILVPSTTPDYLKSSRLPSRLQAPLPSPITPRANTAQPPNHGDNFKLAETTQYGQDTKCNHAHISEVTVDKCVDVCPISPQSPQVKKDDDGHVVKNFSPNRRPFAQLIAGFEPEFLKVEDQDIFMAFEDEGHGLSVALYDLLKRAHAVRIRQKSRDEFLTDLNSWKNEVAIAAIQMIYRVTNVYGHGQNKNEYEWTSDFSIYLWWRSCKIAWDIENYATSQPTNTKILLSGSTLEVFDSLWDAFYMAIHSDIKSVKDDGRLAVESAQKGGFVSIIELLDQHILFQDSPNLESLPAHLYGELGRIRRSITSDENGNQNGIHQLQLLLGRFPVLIHDFERVMRDLQPMDRRMSQLSNLSDDNNPYDHSRTSIHTNIHTDRPFQVYLNRVIVYADRKMAKEVRHIYQSLVQGSESIPRLFNRLRRLLVGAPQLFRQFKDFVPIVAKSRWKAAEESIRTQDQVSNYKRRLRLEWIRLIEEHQEKTGCELPWFNSVESMELEKLQMSMRFLQTAIKKSTPFQSSLTPQAWSRIQVLIKRLRRFTETVASAFVTLDTLTEEKRNEWETSVRIDAASIAEELRRRSVADIEKEELTVSEVKISSP